MTRFDFKVLDSTPKYIGPKIQVNSQKIKTSEGEIVEWDKVMMPDIAYAIPLKPDGEVLMTQEWRPGPECVLTQFTGTRVTLQDGIKELRKELHEELGITGGKFTCLLKNVSNGPHLGGFKIFYLVTEFEISENSPDKNEILEIVSIPAKGLYMELRAKYTNSTETLLGAKLLEDFLFGL